MPWWAFVFFGVVGVVWATACVFAWIDAYRHRDEDNADDTWRDDYTGVGLMLMVTTESVPGYTVLKSLGLALACVPYMGDKYMSGIKDLGGRTHPNLPALLEDQWVGLLRRLNACGQEMGADAIVDIRLESREITSTWRELHAYGTAVKLSPNRTRPA